MVFGTGCPPIDSIPTDSEKNKSANFCDNNQKDEGELGVDCGGTCPGRCQEVLILNELLIRHLAVVDSEMATSGDLSFGKLMERLAPSQAETKDLILSFLTTWASPQKVNGITIPARPMITESLIRMWKRADGVDLDIPLSDWNPKLENAPFRLLAITNRVDLQNLDRHSAGEGRLTFGLAHSGSNDFTLIFEYNLPANTEADVIEWAQAWHNLSSFDNTSDEYLDLLRKIVLSFTSDPQQLNQLRTNEGIAGILQGNFNWELRELNLQGNAFKEVSRKQSPDQGWNNSKELAAYILENKSEIVGGAHELKNDFDGNHFMAGNTVYFEDFVWQVPGMKKDAPEILNLNTMTCSGCHGGLAPNTNFTHIKPRPIGKPADISPFLEGDLAVRRSSVIELLGLEPTPLTASNFPTKRGVRGPEMMQVRSLLKKVKKVRRVH